MAERRQWHSLRILRSNATHENECRRLACVETNLKARLGVRVLEDPGNLAPGFSDALEFKS